MEVLVFRAAKSGHRVVLPAERALIIDRAAGAVAVYALGGDGAGRMVWELPSITAIKIAASMAQALAMKVPLAKAGGGSDKAADAAEDGSGDGSEGDNPAADATS